MEVSIIDNETGKAIATYTVNLSGQNYTPSDEEYYSEAWQCAVDDGVVDKELKDKYSFRKE